MRTIISQTSGDHAGGVPPVPISNTEVKTSRADNTWGASPWESRSSPGNKQNAISNEVAFLCFVILNDRGTGIPPVRSTLQECALRDAVWRKARPPFVYTNTEVKTSRADNTWGVSPWEHRIHTAGVFVMLAC